MVLPDSVEEVGYELYPKNGDQMWESYKSYSAKHQAQSTTTHSSVTQLSAHITSPLTVVKTSFLTAQYAYLSLWCPKARQPSRL
jgi:hypothetical protein